MKARSCRSMLFCGAFSLFVSAVFAAPGSSPPKESVRVELRCKIVKPPLERHQEMDNWVVQIKGVAGEVLAAAMVEDWQIARFRDLQPGVYSVCVLGSLNRRHCESIDLYPPGGRSSYKLSKDFAAPSSQLNRSDLNKVNVSDFAVPQAARDELMRAEMARSKDQIEEAIQHLQEAIRIFPNYTDALNNLGTCYSQKREFVKAEECFRKVTQLNPEFYGGWVNLSGSLMALSRFAEAFEASQHAYDILPQEPIVIGHYAKSLYYLQKYDAAQNQFEKLERVDPVNATYPQLFLAQIALAHGNAAEASQYLKEFLQLHPNNPEGRRWRKILKDIDTLSASVS